MSESESKPTGRGPCPKCPSSDGYVTYDDGHGHCFVCQHHTNGEGNATIPKERKTVSDPRLIEDLEYKHLDKRRLTEETCRHWKYGVGTHNGQTVQVANYFTPDGKLVAQKLRTPDKKFYFLGNPKDAGLYGQHLWRDGGKMIVITEGEIDALSVSQVQNLKWPVVSIPNGAVSAKRDLSKHVEWLEKFETVVLMFDQDKPHTKPDGTVFYPGQDAMKECSELFTPGKCKLARLPLKDANDMLKAGRGSEIVDAIWGAKVHRPDGVVAGTEIWDRMLSQPASDHIPYPWIGLNNLLLGGRRGEIITFCAGTGVGKSAVVGCIAHHFLTVHNETIGYIALEESVEETGWRFTGLEMGKRLMLDRSGVTVEEMKAAYDRTVGSGRLYLYDHWGSTDSDNLFNKIRYYAKGLGCTTIVLDHISIVVSGMEDGDERRLIDNLMTKLASMVKELNIRLLLISHLRKADGQPHEEGGRVTLDQLRGSASIKQLSWDIVALERNQQDPKFNLYTHLRVLKCRRTGMTGSAGWVKYDPDTGRMREDVPVFDEEESSTPSGDAKADDF